MSKPTGWKTKKVRIKKGISPYGGKLLVEAGRETLPDGRVIIRAYPPGQSGVGDWMSHRTIEYKEHEIGEES